MTPLNGLKTGGFDLTPHDIPRILRASQIATSLVQFLRQGENAPT